MNKQQRHEKIRERAREALRDLYHNATPSYPSLEGEEAERFQSWFEDAAQFEIEYLADGGSTPDDYRTTLEHPANAGRYQSPAARAYYVRKGMQDRDLERADCGAMTGWRVLELAAGNKALAKTLRRVYGKQELQRNNAQWERIGEYGKLYQWGRGGRTLAPDGLIGMGGGSSFGIREDYADEMSIGAVVDLIRVLESFNRYVDAWCKSVPEQWAELERERKREKRAAHKHERDRKRAAQAMRDRCETYPG